jgi:hypothetical protein
VLKEAPPPRDRNVARAKTKPRAIFSPGRNPSSYKTIIGNRKTEVKIT